MMGIGLAFLALWVCGDSVPDGAVYEQFPVAIVFPKHSPDLATATACESCNRNHRSGGLRSKVDFTYLDGFINFDLKARDSSSASILGTLFTFATNTKLLSDWV